jgi:hypothetical protein
MSEESDDSDFISQGDFEVDEAEGVLARLRKEGIRFEIEMIEVVRQTTGFSRVRPRFSRVRLYVHRLDLGAWLKVRDELYPV